MYSMASGFRKSNSGKRHSSGSPNSMSASAMPRSFGMSHIMSIPKAMRKAARADGSSGLFISFTKLLQVRKLSVSKPNSCIIRDLAGLLALLGKLLGELLVDAGVGIGVGVQSPFLSCLQLCEGSLLLMFLIECD